MHDHDIGLSGRGRLRHRHPIFDANVAIVGCFLICEGTFPFFMDTIRSIWIRLYEVLSTTIQNGYH